MPAGRTGVGGCAVAALGGMLLAAAAAGPSDAVAEGRRLAFATEHGNCLACHAMAGGRQMGSLGPPLADMRRRFPDRAELRARIRDARDFNPETLMPPFGRHLILTAAEIELIIDFLYTL